MILQTLYSNYGQQRLVIKQFYYFIGFSDHLSSSVYDELYTKLIVNYSSGLGKKNPQWKYKCFQGHVPTKIQRLLHKTSSVTYFDYKIYVVKLIA